MARVRSFIACLALCLLAAPVAAQEAVPILPDLSKSPGAINPELTQDKVCDASFTTKKFRKASKSNRRCVLERYSGKPSYPFTYDHIIPLELGGADSCDNLWPEPRGEDKRKDQVEHALRSHVCVCHDLSLAAAQEMIQTNWIAARARYVTRKGAKMCDVNEMAPGM